MRKWLIVLLSLIVGPLLQAEITVRAFYADCNGIFQPGDPVNLTLEVSNSDAKEVKADILVVMTQYGGRDAARFSFPLTLPAKGTAVHQWNWTAPAENGYFHGKVFLSGKHDFSAECAIAVLPAFERRDPFFGVSCSTLGYRLLDDYKKIGFGSVEFGFPFISFLYPEKETYEDYKAKLASNLHVQQLLRAAEKDEYRFVGILCTAFPRRNSAWPGKKHGYREISMKRSDRQALYAYPDEAYKHIRDHATAVYELFNGKIKIWSAEAEIDAHIADAKNSGSGFATVELANFVLASRNFYEAIKAKDPNAVVSVLGICGGDFFHGNPPMRVSRMLLEDLLNYHDAMSIHAYSGNWSTQAPPTPPEEGGLPEYLRASITLQKELGKEGIVYNTERGYYQKHSDPLAGPSAKLFADLNARSLIIVKGTPGIVYYSFHYGSIEGSQKFLDNLKAKSDFDDGTLWILAPKAKSNFTSSLPPAKASFTYIPRLSAVSFATVAKKLAFAEPVRGNPARLAHHTLAYLFRKEGSVVCAVWTTGEPVSLTFQSSTEMDFSDLMMREKKLPPGAVTLPISGSPVFLSAKITPKELRKLLGDGKFSGGSVLETKVTRTGLDSAILHLRNRTGESLSVACGKQVFSLKPLEENSETVHFSAGEKNLRLTAGQQVYDIPLPPVPTGIHSVRDFAVNGNLTKYPAAVAKLTSPANVFPKKFIIPEYGLLKYDGKDVEAEVFAGWDAANLYLAVKVRDRMHIQRHNGAEMWMDDSVQFAVIPDLTASTLRSVRGFGEGVWNFVMGLGSNGAALYRFASGKREGTLLSYPCTIARNGDLTVYEVAVPWSEFGLSKVGKGRIFGFNMVVFDNNDTANPSAKHYLALKEGLAGGQDPDSFSTLILE